MMSKHNHRNLLENLLKFIALVSPVLLIEVASIFYHEQLAAVHSGLGNVVEIEFVSSCL